MTYGENHSFTYFFGPKDWKSAKFEKIEFFQNFFGTSETICLVYSLFERAKKMLCNHAKVIFEQKSDFEKNWGKTEKKLISLAVAHEGDVSVVT